MQHFIQIKITSQADDTYKRLRVIFGSGSYPYTQDQNRVLARSTSGKLSKQFGPSFKAWYGSFRVKTIEESGYATMDDLYKWMTSNTATDQVLTLRPWEWDASTAPTTYAVSFVTGVDPQPMVPVMASAGGFALVPFRLESR